jgi:large subunit ribosomal protein L24e|tara:strand:+ start:1270 stop:1461 length:192 start_codon:yes stop_codon:yes gene_type:complete
MAKCDFCKKSIPFGTGKKYVQNDGKILDFCTRKCEKNMLVLKRTSRTTRWTNEYHRVKEGKKV